MAQIFTPGADSLARILLVAIGLSPFLALVGSYVIASSPASTNQGAAPAQPIPFSHQHHVAGLGIDCRYCHAGVEKSAVAGLPPTATCMTCHAHIWTNADMLDPVRKSFADNAPIRWNRSISCPITSISTTASTSPRASAAPPATARSSACRRCVRRRP